VAILKIDEVASEGAWAQLRVDGEIDLDTVGILRGQLEEQEGRGRSRLVLDFTETRYVNSSALAVLAKLAQRFREVGGGIALVNVSARVKLPFQMLGLLVFFKFFDTVEEAKQAFAAEAQG
jgi:anti-anti-sigma factor